MSADKLLIFKKANLILQCLGRFKNIYYLFLTVLLWTAQHFVIVKYLCDYVTTAKFCIIK